MTSNKRLLVIAIIIGIITVIALNSYIQSLDKPALATIPYTEVVVAENTIPMHTRITGEMLQMASIPSDAVHPEALLSLDEAVGGISRSEIVRDEQVLGSRVATDDRRASLSYRVPEGMRAVAIPVNEVVGVAGYISPGDKVDVLISYDDDEINETLTVYTTFQNMLVLATGENTREKDNEERMVVGTVTLAVTPGQAEVFAFANQQGSYYLTLRSPIDETEETLDNYSFENFDTYGER